MAIFPVTLPPYNGGNLLNPTYPGSVNDGIPLHGGPFTILMWRDGSPLIIRDEGSGDLIIRDSTAGLVDMLWKFLTVAGKEAEKKESEPFSRFAELGE